MGNTPGPWEVDLETGEITAKGQAVLGTIYGAGDFPCCEEDIDEECKANARLISAAPDLLLIARLFWAIKHEADPDFDMYGVCIELGLENEYMEQKPWMDILEEKAVAAIAKAMGE